MMRRDAWATVRADTISLGKEVRAKRNALKLPMSELVESLGDQPGWNVPSLSRIERGETLPSPELASVLSLWLLQDDLTTDICPTCGQERKA